MYPLTDPVLRLKNIAKHWSRDLPQHPPPDEILDSLIGAMWRGELQIDLLVAEEESLEARRYLLRLLRRSDRHPRLILVNDETDAPQLVTTGEDGMIHVRISKVVIWHADPALQTDLMFDAACATLATAGLADYGPLARSVLPLLLVGRNAFGAYCELTQRRMPGFWFTRRLPGSPMGAKTICKQWLQREVRAEKKRLSKPAYLEEAQILAPGLSERTFDKIWEVTVPPAWKKAGPMAKNRGTPR
jgi:hypothetical protein